MSYEITIKQVNNGFVIMSDDDHTELSVYQSMEELKKAVENEFIFRHIYPIASDSYEEPADDK